MRIRFLKNVIPATFEETLTYIEQLNVLKDKINEVIDLINDSVIESDNESENESDNEEETTND